MNYAKELDFATKLVKKGGADIKKVFEAGNINYKYKTNNPNQIVTQFDIETEKFYFSEIKKQYPEHSIYGEETGKEQKDSEFEWIIDPIDGTTNFSHQIPDYCTMIALKHKNEIVVGVIYAPSLNLFCYASKGSGFYINKKRQKVSNTSKLKNVVIALNRGSENIHFDWIVDHIKKHYHLYKSTRILGSTGIEMSYVASGRLDAMIGNGSKLYDYAPGALFINEAGGEITNFEGQHWTPAMDQVVCSNKELNGKLVKMIKNLN